MAAVISDGVGGHPGTLTSTATTLDTGPITPYAFANIPPAVARAVADRDDHPGLRDRVEGVAQRGRHVSGYNTRDQ